PAPPLPPPPPTLRPYTTLFRSCLVSTTGSCPVRLWLTPPTRCLTSTLASPLESAVAKNASVSPLESAFATADSKGLASVDVRQRSEEHTSELQSRGHLVCRLLL